MSTESLKQEIQDIFSNYYRQAGLPEELIGAKVKQIMTILERNAEKIGMNLVQFCLSGRKNRLQQLEQKISNQKRTITCQQMAAQKKNIELDALHKVWCSGGCATGVHRYSEEEVTQELVDAAVANTKRLVIWWEAVKKKKKG